MFAFAQVKYGVTSPKSPTVLIDWDPANPPPPPSHLGSYTSALLVSQDRLHLFVIPCLCWKSALRRLQTGVPLKKNCKSRALAFLETWGNTGIWRGGGGGGKPPPWELVTMQDLGDIPALLAVFSCFSYNQYIHTPRLYSTEHTRRVQFSKLCVKLLVVDKYFQQKWRKTFCFLELEFNVCNK